MAETIEARVKQKTDTLDNWNNNALVLLSGEQAFVINDNGDPVNFKIGDGTKTFAELPFWIEYNQSGYISYTAEPSQDVGYTIVGEGVYGSINVNAGYMAVLVWDGTSWNKDTEIYVKGDPGTNAQSFNFKGNVPDYASLPSSGNIQNDAWYNLDDKLLYVFNGMSYPPDGDGIDLGAGIAETSWTVNGNMTIVGAQSIAIPGENVSVSIYGVPLDSGWVMFKATDGTTTGTLEISAVLRGESGNAFFENVLIDYPMDMAYGNEYQSISEQYMHPLQGTIGLRTPSGNYYKIEYIFKFDATEGHLKVTKVN
ncbi:hypothetical protein G5B30_07110 [Sphingobacterium sp. SGG-5]|uniref:hypothetical protein n=1 Tax=Sphingobacterium sp. SGG-5 TaxID=2710881 RepID=UPI0013E9C3AF|nr:hypothetical protein [Sphingobacterium sp. SGG-5]NGM61685.1 hypothetical protein [Sphingobacterium sp. SGG-5]